MDRASLQQRFPLGSALERNTLAGDPYPYLDQLRILEPVTWAAQFNRWMVTPRAKCIEVLRNHRVFTTDSPLSPIRASLGAQMLTVDEDHLRHRRAFQPEFRVQALAIDSSLTALQNDLALVTQTFDVVPLARAFATRCVLETLGLPMDWEKVAQAVDVFAEALEGSVDPAVAATRALAIREATTQTLSTPPSLMAELSAGSKLSAASAAIPTGSPQHGCLARIREAENRCALTEQEVGSNVLIVLFGGIETTTSLIANTLWCMATNGIAMSTDTELLGRCIDETFRFEPPVQTLTRYVAEPTELLGVELAAGDIVECMIGAANRDPFTFSDPNRFDINRPNNAEHLTLGIGTHHCIGNHLARQEAIDFLRILTTTLPEHLVDVELTPQPFGHEFRRPATLILKPELQIK